MRDHGILKKTLKKKNPNLTCELQTSNKTWGKRLKSMKHDKAKTYYVGKMKKQKPNGLD